MRSAKHLPVGLQRGRQGFHRPDPLAQGDGAGRATHHRRPSAKDRDQQRRPGDRRDVDRRRWQRALPAGQGRRVGGQCDRHAAVAAAVGQCQTPGWARQLVGPRRQAADDAPLRQRRRAVRGAADELAGPVRRPDREPRVLRDGREARFRARRRAGASRPPVARSTPPCRHAPASRSGDRTTICTSRARSATAPTGASSPRTCRTRRTASRFRRQ